MGSRHATFRRWLLACALLSAPLFSSVGSAQAPDLREIRPFMMLVVDTSGSMERTAECTCVTPSCAECLPDCSLTNDANGIPPAGKKNRWAVTLEALTGSFDDFECNALARIADNGITYDLGYYLPYHQPWHCNSGVEACKATVAASDADLTQNADGVLDTYLTRVRFGLMTFDGWDTYLGAKSLIPYYDYQWALGADEKGLWSYGSYATDGSVITRSDGRIPGRFRYPNCPSDYQMDTGARGPQAPEGGLLSLNSCASPPCDTEAVNNKIQESLLDTRPYGGTPIAAALDDLYYHLSTDLSDEFGSCRGRYAMLITDGYPDDDYRKFGCDCYHNDPADPDTDGYCGNAADNPASMMKCPYDLPQKVAYDLITGRSAGVDPDGNPVQDNPPLEQLFVVGLSITDDAVKQTLNEIAEQGGSPEDVDTGDYALFVDQLDQLKIALDALISQTLTPISRSVPAFARAASSFGAEQFQFSAGFTLPTQVGSPWTGILERKRFTCTGPAEGETLVDGDRFHKVLNAQTDSPIGISCSQSRCLYSVMPANDDPVDPNGPNGHVFGGASGTPCGTTGCDLVELGNSTAFSATRMGLAADATGEATRVDTVNWMYGTGLIDGANNPRQNRKLGDIYHSSPRVVPAPRFDNGDAAYNAFRQRTEVRDRPTMVYINSNDGIIHGFAVEDGSTYPAGTEIWGFVPPLLVDDLPTNLTQHQFTMDGTPVVKDVYFERVSDLSDGSEYHTVLITGMRGGGNAYVALDVTDPFKPKFLWQFTDPDMGPTYGRPAIGQATFRFDLGGGVYETRDRAVAILPGGAGEIADTAAEADAAGCDSTLMVTQSMRTPMNTAYDTLPDSAAAVGYRHRSEVQCWKARGRALYFVDVETGQLLKKIDSSVFPSPLIGAPVLYSDQVGATATSAFVTDADGVIWRIQLRGEGTLLDQMRNEPLKGWTARPFHDIFHDMGPTDGQVAYDRPILSLDSQGQLVLIVGTGNTDNFDNPTVNNRIVSLTEMLVNENAGPEDYKAVFNWEHRVKATPDDMSLVQSELVTGEMVLADGALFYATFATVTGSNACDLGKGRVWAVDYLKSDGVDVSALRPGIYGPSFLSIPADPNSVPFNTAIADSGINLLIPGLATTQRPSCSTVATTTETTQGYTETFGTSQDVSEPPRYLVAQASQSGAGASAVAVELAGSQLSSLSMQLQAAGRTTKVLSWAGAVD